MASVTKDLGIVSAYGYAKAGGYTGTEEEFQAIFNEFTEDAPGLLDRLDEAVDDAEAAEAAAVAANTAAQAAKTAAENAASTFTTDTTLTVSGKAADAKVTGDNFTQLSTAIDFEKMQLFAFGNEQMDSGMIRTGANIGIILPSENYIVSDFIPVKKDDVIKYGLHGTSNAGLICLYETNRPNQYGTYVESGSSASDLTEGTYTVTVDGYLRFCTYKGHTDNYIYFNNYAMPDKIRQELNGIENLLEKTDARTTQNILTDFVDGYIDANGDITGPTTDNEKTSQKIYNLHAAHIKVSYSASKSIWIAVAAYDANGKIIGTRSTYTATGTNKTIDYTCPNGTSYIRYSFRGFDAYTITATGEFSANSNAVNTNHNVDAVDYISSVSQYYGRFKPCYDHLFVTKYGNNIVIPHESLYHVRISKRFGFDMIEANVATTSDGVYFVNHLESGKFGRYFHHVDGETDISDISASSVTWDWIVENVRYNSTVEKYRTRPCTLVEFCSECKQQGLIPLVGAMGDGDVITVVDKIMGNGNYMAYGVTKEQAPGVIRYAWVTKTTKNDILLYCKNQQKPFIYGMANPDSFTDDQLKDIVKFVHDAGYMIGTSYYDNRWYKYAAMGFDCNASQTQVNRLPVGNLYNFDATFGFDNFNYTNATESNGILTYSADGVLTPDVDNTSYQFAIIDIEIWFNGSITVNRIGEMDGNASYTSDGNLPVYLAVPIINGSVKVSISVTGGAEIYNVSYKASKV